MEKGIQSMKNLDATSLAFCVSFAIITISLALIVGHYSTSSSNKRDELMSKNIETAIGKGVDPMAVRCSYSTSTDQICIMYAAGLK
jgi:hypothetical protein